jgi:hypothetical protein
MDKQNVVYIYNGKLFTLKTDATTWINLENTTVDKSFTERQTLYGSTYVRHLTLVKIMDQKIEWRLPGLRRKRMVSYCSIRAQF